MERIFCRLQKEVVRLQKMSQAYYHPFLYVEWDRDHMSDKQNLANAACGLQLEARKRSEILVPSVKIEPMDFFSQAA